VHHFSLSEPTGLACGVTPLIGAAMNGHTQCLELLLAAGSNKEARKKRGFTALLAALENGHVCCVIPLIEAKANLDVRDWEGVPAIIWTTQLGDGYCLSAFIKAGANIEAAHENGKLPLHRIIKNIHTDRPDEPVNLEIANKEHLRAVHSCVLDNNFSALQVLIEAKADLNAKTSLGSTPTILAASEGRNLCLMYLIEAKADLEATDLFGATALHRAAYNGKFDCVRALIAAGANVRSIDKMFKLPTDAAARRGHVDCLRELISADAPVESALNLPFSTLHEAVIGASLDCVETLLNLKVRVDTRNTLGQTPLHTAVTLGSTEIVEALIEAGANPNASVIECYPKMAEAYVKTFSDPSASSKDPYAAELKSIIETDAMVSITPANVRTATLAKAIYEASKNLTASTQDGYRIVIQALLEVNQDTIKEGDTPLDSALHKYFVTNAKVLVEAGAIGGIKFLKEVVRSDFFPLLDSMFHRCLQAFCPSAREANTSRKKLKTVLLSLRFKDAEASVQKPQNPLGSAIAQSHLIMRTIFLSDGALRQDIITIFLRNLYEKVDLSTSQIFINETREVIAYSIVTQFIEKLELLMENCSPTMKTHIKDLLSNPTTVIRLLESINKKITDIKEAKSARKLLEQ